MILEWDGWLGVAANREGLWELKRRSERKKEYYLIIDAGNA